MRAPALLDVNVLVALFDPDHVHHEAAHAWFARHRAEGWATCPLTENGLVRVVSHPAYAPGAGWAALAVGRLRAFGQASDHRFWPDDVSLTDATLFDLASGLPHRQVTDLYLLGLAVRHGGRLATFDRDIPAAKVRGARPGSVELIPA